MTGNLRKTRTQLRWKHWSYGVEVLCGFTDGEHETRKSKHVWTDDDSEPVWITDLEGLFGLQGSRGALLLHVVSSSTVVL